MDDFLSITDAAKSLGVTDRTLRTWIKSGSLTASASTGVAWSEVIRLIKERREQTLDRLPYDAEGSARVTFSTLWPTEDHEIRVPGKGHRIEYRPSADADHAKEVLGGLLAGDAA